MIFLNKFVHLFVQSGCNKNIFYTFMHTNIYIYVYIYIFLNKFVCIVLQFGCDKKKSTGASGRESVTFSKHCLLDALRKLCFHFL